MHINDVGLRIEMIIPDVLQQHGPGHHLAGVFHQIFKQSKLTRLQYDLLSATRDLMREAIELEVADAIHRFLAATTPARKYFRACKQLGKRIGLREIIVAARAQPLDPIVHLTERGQDKRWGLDPFAAQCTYHGKTVELG